VALSQRLQPQHRLKEHRRQQLLADARPDPQQVPVVAADAVSSRHRSLDSPSLAK
jgi:hypothetical protein